jgi:hypothetical protein
MPEMSAIGNSSENNRQETKHRHWDTGRGPSSAGVSLVGEMQAIAHL